MTALVARVRSSYGAHPLQLVLLLASFALAGYAVHVLGIAALWDPDSWWQSIAVWFVGAAVAHDLVLFPAYAAADRVVTAVGRRRPRRTRGVPAVPVTNFVRVPLLACGLVTLMFFPGVIRQGAGSFHRATGLTQDPYLRRWLLLCATFLVLALVCYLVARRRAGRRGVRAADVAAPARDVAAAAPTVSTGSVPPWAVLLLLAVVAARLIAGRRAGREGPVSRS